MAKATLTIAIGGTYDNKAIDKAEKALKDLNVEAARHAGGMTESFAKTGDSLTKLGASMQSAGSKMADMGVSVTKATAPLAAIGVAAVKMAADYENSVAKVYTIMDKSVMSTTDMSDAILDLSTKTGKSATELADATYQALSASIATDKVAGFVEDAVKLSKAGFTETATAVDTLTTVINAYGYKAEDAQEISDKLVQTQNKGKTTVDELSQSIGQVIPTAAAYNVNLDNLCSSYVILTKQGINTANATTMLNGMMSELAKEGSTVNIGLQEMTGKTFGGLMKAGWSLGDVLQLLMDACHGNTEEFANLWGNVRASKGALAIANAGAEEFNATMSDMANSTGLCDKALEDLQTPSAKAGKALNAVKNTGIKLGEEIIGAMVPSIEKLSGMAQDLYKWFSGLDEGTKRNIVTFGGLVVASGPVLTIFGKLYGSVGSLVTKLGHGLQNIGAFSAAMKSAETEMRAAGTTTVGLGTKMKAAADKTGLLTKASGLLKGGLVSLGIGAAVVAVGMIIDAYNRWKEHTDKVQKATTGLETAIDSAKTAYDGYAPSIEGATRSLEDSRKSAEDALTAQAELADQMTEKWKDVGTSAAMVDYYAGVIGELGNKGSLTKEELAKLQTAVDEFNKLTGAGVEITDDMTGSLNRSKEAILGTAEAYKEEARAAAARELLVDIDKRMIENEVELTKAKDELADAQDNYNRVVREHPEAAQAALAKVGEAEQRVNELQAATDSAKRTQEDYLSIISETPTHFKTMEEALDSAGLHIEDLGDVSDEQLEAMRGKFDGTLESIAAACREQGLNIPDGLSKGIEERRDEPVKSAARMIGNVIESIKNLLQSRSPSRVMRQIGADIDSGLAGGIAGGTSGPTGSMSALAKALVGAVSGLPGQARTAGANAAGGMASGVSSGSSGVYNAGRSLATSFNNGVGAVGSYRSGQGVAISAREGMRGVSAYNTGWNFSVGFANGMNGPDIRAAAASVGYSALNSIKKALGIASPSKEAERIGRFFGEGAVIGMRGTEGAIRAESERMSGLMSLDPSLGGFGAPPASHAAHSMVPTAQVVMNVTVNVDARNASEGRAAGTGLAEGLFEEINRRIGGEIWPASYTTV